MKRKSQNQPNNPLKMLDETKCSDTGKQSSIKTKIIIYQIFPCSAVTFSSRRFIKTKKKQHSSDNSFREAINKRIVVRQNLIPEDYVLG